MADSILSGLGGGGGSADSITQLTGDVTALGPDSAVATISNEVVTYAKMQNVSATDKVLGRASSGSGDVEEITCTAAGRALIDDASASAQRATLGLGTIATQDANSVSISGGSVAGITDLAVADGGTGSSTAANARSALGISTFGIPFSIDGFGQIITTGIKGDIKIPYACTITSVDLLADQSGSIVIDIWKDTYANFPPTVADTITASAKPTISAATKSTNSTLTGWTTSIAAGDILRFNVDSVSTITRVSGILNVTR